MEDLVKESIKIMRIFYDTRKENIIAFSGGKDSVVLYDLAKKSGMNFKYIYSNTTIDPPGHISFIKKNFEDVIIMQPEYSFFQLIERKGLPTRMRRFCCMYLKEYVGKGAKVFEGIRLDESVRRRERLKGIKEPEVCDTKVKGKIHVYPILKWSEQNIWKYIRDNNLPISPWYMKGFERLGCIGCPMITTKQRITQYKLYPRYVYASIKAIKKNIDKKGGISKEFLDPYEAFMWWISDKTIAEFKYFSLFDRNYKNEVEMMFPMKK